MKDLLLNHFIYHNGLPVSTITDFIYKTDSPFFEIEDTNKGEIVIHHKMGSGMANIANPDIEAFGFEFYEYTGAQTLTITK